jgi:hypothetical protein
MKTPVKFPVAGCQHKKQSGDDTGHILLKSGSCLWAKVGDGKAAYRGLIIAAGPLS